MEDRVWITGVGAVTPAGWSAEETWQRVTDGKPCITPVTRFETFSSSSRVAGVVPGRQDELPATSLSLEYGLAAAAEAVAQAGLAPGSGLAADAASVATHGERRLPREDGSGRLLGVLDIARRVGAVAGATRVTAPYGACAGSAQAIGSGMALIRSGAADVVLAGGTDSLVTPFDFFSFSSLYVMSTRDCPPEEASCPFDLRRDGFVLAEGAAFVVLESERHAQARGADPLAVAEGFGLRQNAYHVFAPPPDRQGPEQAMAAALRDARLDASDVDWVNAHGTSTKDNDSSESQSIRTIFGSSADTVPVSSSKSQLGHTMGACGAIEAVLSVLALRDGVVPPTSNLEVPDPACDLDYVASGARDGRDLRHVLSNSFGFGGHSASLVFGAVA